MKKGRSFYVFCAMAAACLGLAVWAVVPEDEPATKIEAQTEQSGASERDPVPPATEILAHQKPAAKPDDALFLEALREGNVPTQQLGEQGSLDGALVTREPMVYADSKYNYLPQSPLIEFTDDMIRPDGKGGFIVKRDAMQAQARHIQEASIALSVSPRVEYEKTTGYRLVEIPENTLFSHIGMESGHVIVSIHGGMPDMEPMALMFVNMVAGQRGASTVVIEHQDIKRTMELRAAE